MEDSYILNRRSGRRLQLYPNGEGSYLRKLETVDGRKVEVKVDSAADESVCPEWWFRDFGIQSPQTRMTFKGANGAKIGHLGERSIKAISPF